MPGLPQIAGFCAGWINDRQMLYVCDDYLFSYQRDPADSLRLARAALARNDLTIICNHNWMFYHPWRPEPNPPDIAAWHSLLDDILGTDDCKVISFSAPAGRDWPAIRP